MSKIQVDGREVEIDDDKNLLEGLIEAGIDLPYFCWHPTLGSLGACRMCAVTQFKDAEDTRGRVIMACMTPAKGITHLSLEHKDAADLRKGVIELMMTKHPHDCPVCDAGGQCHLQDMTVMSGHHNRRHRFPKRTFKSQDLGPLVHHEMNRCIDCYRCVRFYKDYAGGEDFNAYASKNHVYFGRRESGTLESEFSGNLVEVCPTGVFTDKTARRHYTRKWDLQMAPSICTHCSIGCNIIPGERYGTVRQVQNRYNHAVNGNFLCDRGRYGYEFTTSDARLHEASEGPLMLSADEATERFTALVREAKGLVGIGSPRASVETNAMLRTLVGPENFFAGVATREDALTRRAMKLSQGPVRVASVQEIEHADAALVLGEDVMGTAPRLALALRQVPLAAARKHTTKLGIHTWNDVATRTAAQALPPGPLYITSLGSTRLDKDAKATLRAHPAVLARFGFAVAHAIDESFEAPEGLSEDQLSLAAQVAADLLEAETPMIVSGTGCGESALLDASAAIGRALLAKGRNPGLSFVLPEANSAGLALFEAQPLEDAFKAVESGLADTVIVVENDLFRRAHALRVTSLFDRARVIVLDHLQTPTVHRAKLRIPAAASLEDTGTFVNQEGRAQRYFEVHVPLGDTASSWAWLGRVARGLGRWPHAPAHEFDAIVDDVADTLPAFVGIAEVAPNSEWRAWAMKLPRQTHRYSGRTSMNALINIHEQKPPQDSNSPYAFSMEGVVGRALGKISSSSAFFWAPSWNSNQAAFRFQSKLGGPLRGQKVGMRLIEPSQDAAALDTRLPTLPEGLEARALVRTFGSEELSNHARGLKLRELTAALRISPRDAQTAGLHDKSPATVIIGGTAISMPVQIDEALTPGVLLVPVGATDAPFLDLPAPAKLSAANRDESLESGPEVRP